MKRAKVTSKHTHKALPGQLDLFGTQNGSAKIEHSERRKTEPKRTRTSNRRAKEVVSAPKGHSKGLNGAAPIRDLVDTQAAALKLGLGVSTLEKMRTQRRGPPFIKLARNCVRYRLSDLEDWIASRVRL